MSSTLYGRHWGCWGYSYIRWSYVCSRTFCLVHRNTFTTTYSSYLREWTRLYCPTRNRPWHFDWGLQWTRHSSLPHGEIMIDENKFWELIRQWEFDTKYLSSSTQILGHPSMTTIIQMG